MRKLLLAAGSDPVRPVRGPARRIAQSSSTLKPEELDQLVAPIALYPDTLLSQVLIASTYPLEVVEAERWAQQNKNLKGDALKKAVDPKKWDDSVKSLAATPDVLAMMSDKLDWTQKLGDAVLAQQADVMDAIQRLASEGAGQRQAEDQQAAEGHDHTQQSGQIISRSSRPSRRRSMFLITIRPLSMARGLIPRIRPITSRRPATSRALRSPPALLSARATRSAPGRVAAVGGAATSTGATTTSTSTTISTSTSATTGSTIRIIATACATTTTT